MIKAQRNWTKDEELFIFNHYNMGPKYISEQLNRKINSVKQKLIRMDLGKTTFYKNIFKKGDKYYVYTDNITLLGEYSSIEEAKLALFLHNNLSKWGD